MAMAIETKRGHGMAVTPLTVSNVLLLLTNSA